MSFKKFRNQDIIYNTIISHPDINFTVTNGQVYYQRQRAGFGDFSNNIKHTNSGNITLHEVNVNRPADGLISTFIDPTSSRFGFKSTTVEEFNQALDAETQITKTYPMSASISRIYIPAGREFPEPTPSAENIQGYLEPHNNKKYIRSLKNLIENSDSLNPSSGYGNLGTTAVNMLCVPGIFYGSKVKKGSVELNYYITGTLVATAKDKNSDGRMIGTYGTTLDQEVGMVIYNQGIIILSSSVKLNTNHTDKYFSGSSGASDNPTWTSFGTGIKQVGTEIEHGAIVNSSYSISLKGTNKVPTMTMFAFSEMGEHNYSSNPSYLKHTGNRLDSEHELTENSYFELEKEVKSTNKSPYQNDNAEYRSTTYITKVGIYDRYKNLIAVASLANPIKKTEKRDFMIKMKMDF